MYAKSTFVVALLAATVANAIPTKPIAARHNHESQDVGYENGHDAVDEHAEHADHAGHEWPEEEVVEEGAEEDADCDEEDAAVDEHADHDHEWPEEEAEEKEEEEDPEPSPVEHGDDPTSAFAIDPEQVTQTVAVGRGGELRFEPNNIVADVGTIVEFHFGPENHGVAQASFADPCQPLIDDETHEQLGFFSGFNFQVDEGQADNVFQLEVTDKDTPVWFYCPQAEHCSAGMVGVINQDADSENNIRAFTEEAAERDNVVPDEEQGGVVGENPNPDAGF